MVLLTVLLEVTCQGLKSTTDGFIDKLHAQANSAGSETLSQTQVQVMKEVELEKLIHTFLSTIFQERNDFKFRRNLIWFLLSNSGQPCRMLYSVFFKWHIKGVIFPSCQAKVAYACRWFFRWPLYRSSQKTSFKPPSFHKVWSISLAAQHWNIEPSSNNCLKSSAKTARTWWKLSGCSL